MGRRAAAAKDFGPRTSASHVLTPSQAESETDCGGGARGAGRLVSLSWVGAARGGHACGATSRGAGGHPRCLPQGAAAAVATAGTRGRAPGGAGPSFRAGARAAAGGARSLCLPHHAASPAVVRGGARCAGRFASRPRASSSGSSAAVSPAGWLCAPSRGHSRAAALPAGEPESAGCGRAGGGHLSVAGRSSRS